MKFFTSLSILVSIAFASSAHAKIKFKIPFVKKDVQISSKTADKVLNPADALNIGPDNIKTHAFDKVIDPANVFKTIKFPFGIKIKSNTVDKVTNPAHFIMTGPLMFGKKV